MVVPGRMIEGDMTFFDVDGRIGKDEIDDACPGFQLALGDQSGQLQARAPRRVTRALRRETTASDRCRSVRARWRPRAPIGNVPSSSTSTDSAARH